MKFATIDIGSNAARLLISEVYPEPQRVDIRKVSLVRVPLRLGFDVFQRNRISKEKAGDLRHTMQAYRHLIDAHHVVDYKACATSAMRTAENGPELVSELESATGLAIDIIDGEREARIIYAAHLAYHYQKHRKYLYIDVGGGSTEMSLFADEQFLESRSFEIGTIRMLEGRVDPEEWVRMESWVKSITTPHRHVEAIGTGGNINKMHKMSDKKVGIPLTTEYLQQQRDHIARMSVEDRINVLKLRADRADVIVPACDIYLFALRKTGIRKIHVPRIGLVDGLAYLLYERHVNGHPVPLIEKPGQDAE